VYWYSASFGNARQPVHQLKEPADPTDRSPDRIRWQAAAETDPEQIEIK
jgi:hypothetical protein